MEADIENARALPATLRKLDSEYAATVAPNIPHSRHRIDHHRIFLRLYYFSTRRWIEFAEQSDHKPFFDQLLVEFYRRYRNYVFAPATDKAPCLCPHWKPYFQSAAAYRRRPGPDTRNALLLTGVFAHVRFDLAESIASALRAHEPDSAGPAWLSTIRREMFDKRSDAIFSRTASDFILRAEELLPELNYTVVERALCLYYTRDTRWWLPYLQEWRRAAWTDAIRMLDAGRTTFGASRSRLAVEQPLLDTL